ncbi:MAG TPA: cytochrome P450 [Acidimicrobiia bacterium]|nr:cytochrome P450 [Acidimicrobiia bacterium]
MSDTRVFWDPAAYADQAAWHATVAEFRRSEPVVRVESPHHPPFWAVTRHADIHWIERHPEQFPNTDRPVLATERQYEAQARQGAALRTLIHMDGDEHRRHRAVTANWFKPSSVRSLEQAVAGLARAAVDHMAGLGGECDFVADVALHYPLRVILSILGLPPGDEDRMLTLTQELFGSADPALRRAGTRATDQAVVIKDLFGYFSALTADRRARPTDDLASVIANADIDGEPLAATTMLSYYVLIATAGHDTTSASLAGGLGALIDHPDQLARLRAEPGLIPGAADEIVRWVSPVRHFMRHATERAELGGVTVDQGDTLLLSYPSANRDDAVFDDPFRFDVARPNADRHLGFGFGVHHCLGAHLARLELASFFTELLPRLDSIERAGPEEQIHATFVGGPRRLPVRFRLR